MSDPLHTGKHLFCFFLFFARTDTLVTYDMTTTLAPGDSILGKYRVEGVLGQGGMGYVVAARHVDLGELYAIKVMLPNQDGAQRFLREARAAAKLKGEHIARVHDVDRADDGTLFMVMEYLEGSDLKKHLALHGRMPAHDAITLVIQACDALAEAHEMAIVHRDIKPANLLLTRKRKTAAPHLKVLDFGISKELQREPGQDLTKTGAMLGSPLYMSPEQMAHARKVDARTDVWSLGVVLYELVTGRVPFPGETFTQVVHGVMSLEPASIRSFVADLPAGLDEVIQRCLQKDPARRYPNVEELSAALGRVLKDEPVENVRTDEGCADTVKAVSSAREAANDLDTTDVGSSEPFADKRFPEAETAERSSAESSSFNTRKSDQPMATTLRSEAPPALDAPRPRRQRMDYVVATMAALAAVGIAAIGLRSTRGAGASASHAADANAPQSAITAEQTTAPNVPMVASIMASSVEVVSASSSASVVATSSKLVVPARTASTKPSSTASVSTSPSPKPSADERWRQGPL